MKLITELNENVAPLIVENTKEGKNYFIEGIYIQCESKNRNGRIYSMRDMEPEVNRYINEVINTNRAVGELGHPTTPTINYDRACVKHLSLVREGNDFIGRSQVLTNLPMGQIIKGLIDSDVAFGTSTRGVGALKQNTARNVTEVHNYKLATAGDCVSDPSAGNAWVRGIMEGVDWVYDTISGHYHEERLGEMTEKVKKIIHAAPKSQISEELKLSIFNKFMDLL